MNDLLQAELMLLSWQETSTGGCKLVFAVSPEDLEKFHGLTLAKNGKGGQRFMAALAVIADDETPEPLPVGPLCKLAVIWCKDPAFQVWLSLTYPGEWRKHDLDDEASAKAVLCAVCGIQSRKDLDYTVDGRKMFNELIRRPYAAYLGESA